MEQQVFIKETIERHGMDAQAIADAMGCQRQNVYYLMREGGTQTKVSTLMTIAQIIGVTDLREFFTPPEEYDSLQRMAASEGVKEAVMICPNCGQCLKVTLSAI